MAGIGRFAMVDLREWDEFQCRPSCRDITLKTQLLGPVLAICLEDTGRTGTPGFLVGFGKGFMELVWTLLLVFMSQVQTVTSLSPLLPFHHHSLSVTFP